MEELKEALKSGRKLIDIDKFNAKGYLRTGRTLEKMERYDLALKFYGHGLRCVSKSDAQYELLQRMFDRAQKLSLPVPKIDPFEVLPVEIITMIFSYLAFHKTCQCLRVSKLWKKLLSGNYELWSEIDFATHLANNKPISYKAFMHYLFNSQHRLRKVVLRRMGFSNTKALEIMSNKCKLLHALTIAGSHHIEQPEIRMISNFKSLTHLHLSGLSRLTISSFISLLGAAPKLTHMICGEVAFPGSINYLDKGTHVPACPDLQLLDVTFSNRQKPHTPSTNFTLDSLCTLCSYPELISGIQTTASGEAEPRDLHRVQTYLESRILPKVGSPLRTLRLKSDHHCEVEDMGEYLDEANALEELVLDTFIPFNIFSRTPTHQDSDPNLIDTYRLQIPASTRSVTLIGIPVWRIGRDLTVAGIAGEASPLPALERLRCSFPTVSALNYDILSQLLRASDKAGSMLKFFRVDAAFAEADEMTRLLVHPRLQQLEEMALASDRYLDDTVAQLIAQSIPNLKILDVSATNITGVGFKALVTNLKHLENLNVNDCHNLSPDAVEWARKRGIRVKYYFKT